MIYDLVIVRGPAAGTRYPLQPGAYVVGRSSTCDITIEDEEVSRQHLHVSIDHRGVRVRDADSLNGTVVAGTPITQEAEIAPGDTIEIGETVVTFELAAPPTRVRATELAQPEHEWTIPVGLGPHRTPVYADLSSAHLVIIGPYRSGRTTALATITAGAHRLTTPPAIDLLAPRPSRLSEASGWRSLVIGRDDVELALAGSEGMIGQAEKALVLIDDAEDLFDDDSVEFERALRQARRAPVRFVIAAETKAAHACFGGWFLEARKHRHGIVLQPDPVLDGQLFGVDLPDDRHRRGPGSGYVIRDGDISAVQIATDL